MKKHIIYFVFLLTGVGYSQDLPTYAPVSPNAASLGKFGTFPVNTNLGTTDISIPLYTIKQGDIELPITLRYNATSGIRVNEEASWVGLGWTLEAGGAIVRNVKGQPGASDIPDLTNVEFNNTFTRYFRDIEQNRADSNHDEYIFNYSGISGKFIYNQNDQRFIFIDYKPVLINGTINGEGDYFFTATTENGTVLNFDDHERITILQNSQIAYSFREYISSYYLSKVTSANRKDIITLDYDNQEIDKKYEITGDQISMDLALYYPGWRPNPPKVSAPKPFRATEKTLKRINFKSGYVVFDYDLNREDSESAKLNHIKVYTTDDGVENLIKQITFKYDYYSRSGGGYYPEHQKLSGPHYSKSLRLNGVDVYSNTDEPQSYRFEYSSTTLPLRTSSGQDFWGYANKNSGSYIHKHETDFHFMADEGKTVSYKMEVGNGDRSPDEEKMKAGILEKIVYPTGGYTLFDYEANKYEVLANVPEYGHQTVSVSSRGIGTRDGYSCDPTGVDRKVFRPQQNNIVEAKLNISFTNASDKITSSNPPRNGGTSYVKFNNEIYKRKAGCSPQYCATTYNIDLINLSNSFEYDLEAREDGNGALGAEPCPSVYANVSWKYIKDYNEETVTHLVGGLRIKSITNYDGAHTYFTSKKEFEYDKPSVLIPVDLTNFHTLHKVHDNYHLRNIITSYPTYSMNVNSGPSIEYTRITEYNYDHSEKNNGKIVYEYESTPAHKIIDDGAIGSDFKYYHHPDFFDCPGADGILDTYLGTIKTFGYGNFINFFVKSWASGSLKKQDIYKLDFDNSFVKVKSIENGYLSVDQTSIPYNYTHPVIQLGLADYPGDGSSQCASENFSFLYTMGFYSFGKKLLTSTIETTYDTHGQNPIVTEKTFDYNHPNYFLTESTTKDSDGKEFKTRNYYPANVESISGLSLPEKNAIKRLQKNDLHQIATPIQIENLEKNGTVHKKLSTQRTLFKDWGNNLVLPEFVQTLKGNENPTNLLENRIQYHNYDPQGNPIEISKTDGSHVVYIWGYQDQFPIAKIENVTYTDVSSYISNLKTKSNADNDRTIGYTGKEGALRQDLDALRTVLPNAMVSTYTYDPLIGVTSMTDPKGYTSYFEYDDSNRLQFVKDAEGNLVSENKYHYKGQSN